MKRFKQYIRSGLSAMAQRHQEFIYHQLDEDTIHDLRVSIRRFTPVLNLLIQLEHGKKHKKQLVHHRHVFRSVFKGLSGPRDLDVQIQLAQTLSQKHPEYEAALQPYIRALSRCQQSLTAHLSDIIPIEKMDQSMTSLYQWIEQCQFQKVALKASVATAHEVLKAKLKHNIHALRDDLTQFHVTRIQLKKFRYLLELETEIFETPSQSLTQLKQIQDHLGETQDLFVALQLMADHQMPHDVIMRVDSMYQASLRQSTDFIFSKRALLVG